MGCKLAPAALLALLLALGAAPAQAAPQPPPRLQPLSAHAPIGFLSPSQNQTVRFHAQRGLPAGSYYYAVAVLEHYVSRGGGTAPACALSSDMGHVQYAPPRSAGATRITLPPAPSAAAGWCPGGVYEGAVYAVPHRPPCTREYRCVSGSRSCPGTGTVCGVVPKPVGEYGYPGGLPKPIDRSSRIVARFTLRFGALPEQSLFGPYGSSPLTSTEADLLLRLVRSEAAALGDQHPYDIEATEATQAGIARAEGGQAFFPEPGGAAELLYVAARGHFVCGRCKVRAGSPAPRGSVIALGVPPEGASRGDLSLPGAYPKMLIEGRLPVRLG